MSITVTTTLMERTCPRCGGIYAIAQEYFNEAKQLGGFKQCWTCPYCKEERGFSESELDRVRKQLESERARAAQLSSSLQSVREERDRHWTERKKLQTRTRNLKLRVKHGVCPCCQRTFKQLATHMKAKHPDYNPDAEK